MSAFLRWSCLLSLALLAPTNLPAGGLEFHSPLIRRREMDGPFLSIRGLSLFSSPNIAAPRLQSIPVGSPLKVLHSWTNYDGSTWLFIKSCSGAGLLRSNSGKRGWVRWMT